MTFNFVPIDGDAEIHMFGEGGIDVEDREIPFSSPETWKEALNQLNLKLARQDLPDIHLTPQMTDADFSRLINTVHQLLGNLVSQPRQQDLDAEAVSRLESDLHASQNQISELKE